MTVSKPPFLIQGEAIEMLPTRVLLGWAANVQEAEQLVLGRQSASPAEAAEFARSFEGAKARVHARGAVVPSAPLLQRTPELDEKLRGAAARADVQAAFAGMNWRTELVDLRK